MAQFVQGLRAYAPSERAPDFVKANLSVNRDELIEWLRQQDEQVKIDVKESKKGNWYAELNTYQKKESTDVENVGTTNDYDDIAPF